jgi:type III secretion protein Q
MRPDLTHRPTSSELQLLPLAGLLPDVPAADAAVSRVLRDRRLPALLGGNAALRIGCARADALPDAPLYRVRAHCAGGPINVLLHAPGLGSLATAASKETPPALRPLVAEAALAPWAEAMQRCAVEGFEVQAIEVAAFDAMARARPWYDVQHHGQAVAWFACLDVPPLLLQDAHARLAGQRAGVGSAWAALALRGRVRLCEQPLPWSVLREMACGDVLLTPLNAAAPALAVQVHWGAHGERMLRAPASLAGATLTFSGAPSMDQEAAAPAATMNELELPVHFELDTVAMPLAELQALQAGAVIEMPTLLSEATLKLVACGQTIAHAELVAVGGRIGARITRLLLQDDHAEPG